MAFLAFNKEETTLTLLLQRYGFDPFYEEAFQSYNLTSCQPGRIALEHKHLYRVWTADGEIMADISGKMRYEAGGREDYPAVGDWVAVNVRKEEGKGTIHAVLPRKSKFSRKMAGKELDEQIVATNVNTIFLVAALNQDFNLRRLERYLVLAWESGAKPVVILSKADLCTDLEQIRENVNSIAFGVPVIALSAQTGQGIEQLNDFLTEGHTLALLGSSGVGKSTIVNFLMGKEVLKTQEIREDDARGRHTTTHREMFLLPCGAILIDTPGMREIQLWDADEGMSGTFDDIEDLTSRCQFHDCRHDTEPGCAVKEALTEGTLLLERYESYRKLQRELAYLATKGDRLAAQANKEKWKSISKFSKNSKKSKY
jgi:ribosome biogenesis GTPase